MLRARDLKPTDRDVRSMAFPRIAAPMDADWNPSGFRLSSLRHPIRNVKQLLKAKWNNARCDIWVFLGLKQPPWADPGTLTYLTYAYLPSQETIDADTANLINRMHHSMLNELRQWKSNNKNQLPE